MPRYLALGTAPAATFSPGVELDTPKRWLFISGQVGRNDNGQIPDGIEAQAELAWTNLGAVLTAAKMTVNDLVDLTIYLTSRADSPVFDEVRRRWLNGAKPCSTKIFVSGFVDEKMVCEIQATAAQ